MGTGAVSADFNVQKFLAAHPEFERKLTQFMMLYDAADVLGELETPHRRWDNAAEYLTETANHIMRDAGIPEEFLQAMIAARPPVP